MDEGTYKPQLSYRVSVTQEDIDASRMGDSYNCVVVRAIARHIPAAKSIRVDDRDIRFTLGDLRLTYAAPWRVQGYLQAFDGGEPPVPFTFGLRDPIVRQVQRRTAAGTALAVARQKVKRARTPATRAKAEAQLAQVEAAEAGKPRVSGETEYKNRPRGVGRPPRVRHFGERNIGHYGDA